MFHWIDVVRQDSGPALPKWQVECVQSSDHQTIVPIFADKNSTPIVSISGIANRAVSDEAGNYEFFVPDGEYSLRFYNEEGVFQDDRRGLPMYGNQLTGGESIAALQAKADANEIAVAAAGTAAAAAQATANGAVQTATLAGTGGAGLVGFPDGDTLDNKITPTVGTVAALKASTSQSVVLTGVNGGLFVRQTTGGPFVADDVNVFKANDADLSAAAYVRDSGDPISNPGNDQFAGNQTAYAIIRKTSDVAAIELLNNATHVTLGYDSVFVSDGTDGFDEGTIKAVNSVPGYTNGIHQITMDEVYAGQGVIGGIKGFNTGANIYLTRPLEFTINLNSISSGAPANTGVTEHPYWDGEIMAAKDNTTGLITIDHPNVALAAAPTLLDCYSNGYEVRVITSRDDQLVLQLFNPFGGAIRKSGANLVYDGKAATPPTPTFDPATGILTIALNQTLPNGFHHDYYVQSIQAGVRVDRIVMSGRNSLAVYLTDLTGAAITSDTGLRVNFGFPQYSVPQTLATGVIRILRDRARVNFNKMANPTANIWLRSDMPYAKK